MTPVLIPRCNGVGKPLKKTHTRSGGTGVRTRDLPNAKWRAKRLATVLGFSSSSYPLIYIIYLTRFSNTSLLGLSLSILFISLNIFISAASNILWIIIVSGLLSALHISSTLFHIFPLLLVQIFLWQIIIFSKKFEETQLRRERCCQQCLKPGQ
jgi:hypothetical protein